MRATSLACLLLTGCATTGSGSLPLNFTVETARGCVEVADDGGRIIADAEFVGVLDLDGEQVFEFAVKVGPTDDVIGDKQVTIPASARLSGFGVVDIQTGLTCSAKLRAGKPVLHCLPVSANRTPSSPEPVRDPVTPSEAPESPESPAEPALPADLPVPGESP